MHRWQVIESLQGGALTAAGRWGSFAASGSFDAVVVVLSFMPALGVDASLLPLARAARLLHLARHLTHLAPRLRLARLLRVDALLDLPAAGFQVRWSDHSI
jgi:hypothetical protein